MNKYVLEYIKLTRAGLATILPGLREVGAEEIPEVQKVSRSDAFRMDENIEAKIHRLFLHIGEQLTRSFDEFKVRKSIFGMIRHVNKASKKNTQKQLSAGYKRTSSFSNTDKIPDFEPMMRDNELNPYFENIVDENVGLVKSISEYRKVTFKNALVSAITRDASQDEIAKIIQSQFGKTRDKARLLARDQVGKLNGALNKYRQEQLGAKRYIWRSSGDIRERKDHRALNNKTQYWSKPPIVDKRTGRRGHPGEDYQCRCWAEMVLDDILD